MRSLHGTFAQYERALIRARTRAALAMKKARGERTGGVPLGSSVGADGRLVVDATEAASVARARELRTRGLSLREAEDVLDADGHRPRRNRWLVQALARLVSS